jgi:hypothetical protein
MRRGASAGGFRRRPDQKARWSELGPSSAAGLRFEDAVELTSGAACRPLTRAGPATTVQAIDFSGAFCCNHSMRAAMMRGRYGWYAGLAGVLVLDLRLGEFGGYTYLLSQRPHSKSKSNKRSGNFGDFGALPLVLPPGRTEVSVNPRGRVRRSCRLTSPPEVLFSRQE